MSEKMIVKEVALCARNRCPILVLQKLASSERVNIPLGLVEACLLGCAIHEGGAGTERCTALLAEALKEASGELVAIEIRRGASGQWTAELTFSKEDGTLKRQRCRPADAATLAVAFGVPLTMGERIGAREGSDELSPTKVAHWLATLAPEDFLGHEGGPS